MLISDLKLFWKATKNAHLDAVKIILPNFYKFKFSTWDFLVFRHKISFINLIKLFFSKILRRHHFYDCLNTDLAKLYLCLSFDNNNDNDFLIKSKKYFNMLSFVKNNDSLLWDLGQYVNQLTLNDINSQMFIKRGDKIFYE